MKRLTVLPILAAVLVIAPLAGARLHASQSTTVKVTATEYKFTLSRKSAPHGTVVFKVVNKGKIAHDFKIAGKKIPSIKPGKSATLKVTLKKRKYTYVCTIDSHANFGMKGVFKAT